MAAKIKDALGVEVTLVPEGKGIFDVSVDNNLVYSKFKTGVFPEEDELVEALVTNYAQS